MRSLELLLTIAPLSSFEQHTPFRRLPDLARHSCWSDPQEINRLLISSSHYIAPVMPKVFRNSSRTFFLVQGQLHTEFMTVVPISLRRGVETECPRRLFRGKISLLRIKVPRVPRTISQEAPSTRHLQELVPNSEQPVLGAGNLWPTSLESWLVLNREFLFVLCGVVESVTSDWIVTRTAAPKQLKLDHPLTLVNAGKA